MEKQIAKIIDKAAVAGLDYRTHSLGFSMSSGARMGVVFFMGDCAEALKGLFKKSAKFTYKIEPVTYKFAPELKYTGVYVTEAK